MHMHKKEDLHTSQSSQGLVLPDSRGWSVLMQTLQNDNAVFKHCLCFK